MSGPGSALGTTGAGAAACASAFFLAFGGVTSRQRWAISRLMLSRQLRATPAELNVTHQRSQGRPPSQTMCLGWVSVPMQRVGVSVVVTHDRRQ